jgi:uncharacterized protein DUF5022
MKKTICIAFIVILSLSNTISAFAMKGTKRLISTNFEEISQLSDGSYVVSEEPDMYYYTGRLDIDLQSEKSVKNALANPDLTQEIKDEIIYKQNLAKETGEELQCTVFSPELLPEGVTKSVQSTYYTYKGARMRSDFVYTSGVSTGWRYLKNGSGSSQTADGIVNLLLLAGSKNSVLSFLSAGKTVLDFFISQWGSSYITGHRNDYLQMRLIYNDAKQWTYREYAPSSNDWRLGLCTQRVTVTKVGTEQYYFNGSSGRTTTRDTSTSFTFKSTHYDSPWATAYQWVSSPLTEWVSWKCAGKTFLF